MLIAALRPVDAARCDIVRDQLHEYVAAQLAAAVDLKRFGALATHLDACEECSGAFARLYELEYTLLGAGLPELAQTPSFDLSFLAAWTPTLTDRLHAATRRLGTELSLQLDATLRALLLPPRASRTLRSVSAAPRDTLVVLTSDAARQADLPLTFDVYREPQHPASCRIEVGVRLPGRGWPDLDAIPVRLIYDGGEQHALTDAWGLAAFPEVPLPALDSLRIVVVLPE
jgi:hypothetical protein